MTSAALLKSKSERQSTDVLLSSMLLLEKRGMREEAERLTHAVIGDVLLARLGIEYEFDVIFFDEDFDGTYAEAMLMAMAANEGAA